MPQPIIEVKNISKKYRIGRKEQYFSMRDSLVRLAKQLLPRAGTGAGGNPGDTEFWALKDVTFAIETGDVVGIIGRNGAGKTTLLKILSRITHPTEGEALLRGRVASLLEVGTGFHPELTGRENIYFNGSMLGMKKKEIDRKFDEIVAFSEIERFIDTPVKRYSSGMYVRLAFSVAAHLEPEV
ncbi:MAG: ABC transporter ATP-binding protein, partial [Endomicrobiales bacterium]